MDYYNLQNIPMPNDNGPMFSTQYYTPEEQYYYKPSEEKQQQQSPSPKPKRKKKKRSYTNILFYALCIFVLLVFIGWISQRNTAPKNYGSSSSLDRSFV